MKVVLQKDRKENNILDSGGKGGVGDRVKKGKERERETREKRPWKKI